jgi:hypothetical protein
VIVVLEPERSPFDTAAERQECGHFGTDLQNFQAKTPEKGERFASFVYLWVNVEFS